MRRPQLDNKGIKVSTIKKRKIEKIINVEIDTEVIKNTFVQVTLNI